MDEGKKEVVRILSKKYIIQESILETPPEPEMGDIALPCFTLAKEYKKSPVAIAQEIVKTIEPAGLVRELKALGPYVNFFLSKEKISQTLFEDILKLKNDFGKSLFGRGKQIMLEFPSPNTNKPLHLGHVRNCFIGSTLSNLLEACSYKVIRANLINDRGIHICKSMLAYMKFGNNTEPDIKPDHFVGKYYVLYSQKEKEIPELESEGYNLLRRWEAGERDVVMLWKKMNNWVYKGFDETLDRLGVKIDVTYYESEFYKQAKTLVLEAAEKGIFEKDEKGNLIANLEEKNLPNKVVIRADGTSIYATQDIFLAKKKFDEFPEVEKSIIITMHEQQMHLKQVFAILERMNYSFANKCMHIMYGIVNLPEGRMKSREGTVVDADDLMDEMIELARDAIKERHQNLSEKELKERARIIAMCALELHFLKFDDKKDIIFNPKEAISFEGESGPYIQYVYARIASILEKANTKVEKNINHTLLKASTEQKLISLLASFPTVVQTAALQYRSAEIPHYLLKVAQTFNEFYHACPVLQAEEETKKARILLIFCVKQVIKNGLFLIGCECLEEM